MDHVSHFTALSQTRSVLVQNGRERGGEGGDEGNKKDKGGEIGVWV